jgi:hypothetical protein
MACPVKDHVRERFLEKETGGVNLVTIFPTLLTGPVFSASCASSTVSYLKGAREMYEKNMLATVDVWRTRVDSDFGNVYSLCGH